MVDIIMVYFAILIRFLAGFALLVVLGTLLRNFLDDRKVNREKSILTLVDEGLEQTPIPKA